MGSKQVLVGPAAGILWGIATLRQPAADPRPTRIGRCSRATIGRIGTILEGIAGSGGA